MTSFFDLLLTCWNSCWVSSVVTVKALTYWAIDHSFWSYLDGFRYFYASDYTLLFTLKITSCLAFLILIRGGVPRYRYDFLTKLGWVKFLGYVLTLFVLSVALFLLW